MSFLTQSHQVFLLLVQLRQMLYCSTVTYLPSLLWHHWIYGRKGRRPVEKLS